MIELADYFMGRDHEFAHLLGADLRKNAGLVVEVANKLLVLAKASGVPLEANPSTKTVVNSGWRPPAVNAAIPNAAPRSRHLTCQAIDLYDPEGALDEWLMGFTGQKVLADLGLWMEHPSATKGWSHVQTVPPRSGNRVFYP